MLFFITQACMHNHTMKAKSKVLYYNAEVYRYIKDTWPAVATLYTDYFQEGNIHMQLSVCVGAPKGLTDSFSYTLDIFMKTKFTVVPTHRTPQ